MVDVDLCTITLYLTYILFRNKWKCTGMDNYKQRRHAFVTRSHGCVKNILLFVHVQVKIKLLFSVSLEIRLFKLLEN